MNETIKVQLTLTCDTPNSMHFADTHAGLHRIWYKFECDAAGSITLFANPDGFEHLARYFLKMARTGKRVGYHGHHALEYGGRPSEGPELTITLGEAPPGFFGPEETSESSAK
jgi:hypothetical protein